MNQTKNYPSKFIYKWLSNRDTNTTLEVLEPTKRWAKRLFGNESFVTTKYQSLKHRRKVAKSLPAFYWAHFSSLRMNHITLYLHLHHRTSRVKMLQMEMQYTANSPRTYTKRYAATLIVRTALGVELVSFSIFRYSVSIRELFFTLQARPTLDRIISMNIRRRVVKCKSKNKISRFVNLLLS